jgi:phage baseplate assembly protein gpV/phage protein D
VRPAAAAPAIRVRVDGSPLDTMAHALVSSVRVARRLAQPAQCEVAFALGGASLVADDVANRAPIGSRLTIAIDGDPIDLFDGDVTAHEWQYDPDGGGEVRLRAYDELHRLRKRQRLLARIDTDLGTLLSELADEAGLDVDPPRGSAPWPVLAQHAHDDLRLLTSLGERAGLYAVVDEGVLRLVDLSGGGDPVVLRLGDSLFSARFEINADPACRSVTAAGWDPVTTEVLAGGATKPRSARPPSGTTAPSRVGASGERFLTGHHGPSADHLDAASQAELDRKVAAEVVIVGVAAGDARLRPGRRIEVEGVNAAVAGPYVLTETTHTLDGAGYAVALSSEPPRPEPATGGAEVTVGEVLSADDPASLGRVRLGLPAYGGIETDWREVVAPGAGVGKGLVAVPERGDRVLVVLPGGDPASAVVVGGFYGGAGMPDTGVVAGSVQRWSLITSGGQRVVFDDEGSQLVLADRTGSALVMSPDRVTLHAAADLHIQAPGRTITIRADRLDMQRASSPGGGPTLPPPHPGGHD